MGECEQNVSSSESKMSKKWERDLWAPYYHPSLVTAVIHNLWTKFAFLYRDFVDKTAVMEQYGNEVSLAVFEWCGSELQAFHLERVVRWCDFSTNGFPRVHDRSRVSSPCLNCLGWQLKIKHPPLILAVLGGRTRAHLDESSQAFSHYLNCIGWQDKPSVDLLMTRLVTGAWCCTF